MPEGDTVHRSARTLHGALAGARLAQGELRHPRLATARLAGLEVREVVAIGKHLLVRFDDGTSLHSHLRMDGMWQLYRPGQRWRAPAHQVRAVLATTERVAVGFRLHDLALLATADEHRVIGHLGPDLLDPDWDLRREDEAVARLADAGDRELGLALLDQRLLAGLGNLYRAEACFLLGVSPWTLVSEVDARSVVRLCRELLRRGAAGPRQSTTGELAADRRHWVYYRSGQPCRRCGSTVRSATQGSGTGQVDAERVVYFCPRCQPAC